MSFINNMQSNLYLLLLSLSFMFGVFVQAYLLIRNRFKKGDILPLFYIFWVCFGGILGGIFLKRESFHLVFFVVAIMFSLLVAAIFKEKILVKINESILLLWLTLFWYFNLTKYLWNNYVIVFLSISTILIVLVSFFNLKLSFKMKVFLYITYLVILIMFSLVQIDLINIDFFKNGMATSSENITDMFFGGMVLMYILSHLWFIFEIIPLPAFTKEDANKDYKVALGEKFKEAKRNSEILAGNFLSDEFSGQMRFIIIFSFAFLLLINYNFNFLSNNLLIALCVVIANFLADKKETRILVK